jgi:hypothetical protein
MPCNFKTTALIPFFIYLIFLSACANPDKAKEVVAYVNKEPIYLSELKREISRRAKSDPSVKITPETKNELLQSLIERRLIVQAAMKIGLARQEKFVNTIKAFWEQTLIRDFIDYLNSQAQDYIFVTNEDIKEYYDNLSVKVTFRILRATDPATFNEACKKYLKDKDISSWQVLGPVGYEDISDFALLDAFGMPIGEVRRYEEPNNYYLIVVTAKEPVSIAPLEKLKADLEKRVIVLKERRLFEDYLKAVRDRANIKVSKEYLQ